MEAFLLVKSVSATMRAAGNNAIAHLFLCIVLFVGWGGANEPLWCVRPCVHLLECARGACGNSRSTNRGGLTRLLVSGRRALVSSGLKGGRWQRSAHSPLTAHLLDIIMSSHLIHICCVLLVAAQAFASLDSSAILQRALHKKCLHAYTPACFKMEVVALVDKLSAHDSYQVSSSHFNPSYLFLNIC